jgi:hypothetical protein
MTAHSQIFSPSRASMRLGCPGSARMEAGFPDTTNQYAEEGSAAHFLCETCLTKGENVAKYKGRRIVKVDGTFGSILQAGTKRNDGFEVTLEMVEAAQIYLDYVRSHGPAGGIHNVEHRVEITPEAFGTADHDYAVPLGPLYVDDLKYGQGVMVGAEWNPQAMCYALGVLQASPYDHHCVRISIIQPRGRDPLNNPIPWLSTPENPVVIPGIDGWEISTADLYKWKREVLLPGIERCKDPNAPLAAGDHCKFCKAKGGCPEVHKDVMAVVPIQNPAGLLIPALLTNDQLAVILDKASVARAWLDEVEALAFRKVEAGEVIIGTSGQYKVVEGRGSRDWLDPALAENQLEKILAERAYERKLLSPAKAETALKECGLNPKDLAPLIVKKAGKPTLAPASDKRPALASSAERAFAAINIG